MNNNTTPDGELPKIIFEDHDLIVVDKPSGLLSIPDGYDANLPHLRSVLSPSLGELWMVHRLDKETSGVMLLARNARMHRQLNQIFRNRQIAKVYHGLVVPKPDWQVKDIHCSLRPNADRKHRTRVDPINGKQAQSICTVLKRFKRGVLMEIQILTGITHQIRAHLRTHNLTLLGEQLYNAGLPTQPTCLSVSRIMLHARSLAFTHPSTNTPIHVKAPYPDDFRKAYKILKIL